MWSSASGPSSLLRIGDQSRRRHPPPLLPVPRSPHTVRHRHPRPFFHVVHPSSSRSSPCPFSVHISLAYECWQLVRSDHVSEVAQFPSFHHLQQPSLRHQLLQYGFVCSKQRLLLPLYSSGDTAKASLPYSLLPCVYIGLVLPGYVCLVPSACPCISLSVCSCPLYCMAVGLHTNV